MSIHKSNIIKTRLLWEAKIRIMSSRAKDLSHEAPALTRIRAVASMAKNITVAPSRRDTTQTTITAAKILGTTNHPTRAGSRRPVTSISMDQTVQDQNTTTRRMEVMTTAIKTSPGTIPEVTATTSPAFPQILK
jgi:hypothetical protein